MSYKLYKVRFDTNPGGWKHGSDPYKLVLAKNPQQAKDIAVKGSWSEEFGREDKDDYSSGFVENWRYNEDSKSFDYTMYSEEKGNIEITVTEIRFEGFEMRIDTVRGHKINDILGDE